MADLRATLDKKDYKYIVQKPDKNFSVERNKAIINETVTQTEKFFQEMYNPLTERMRERFHIIAKYGNYRLNKGQQGFKEYVGEKLYKELIGEKISSKVRLMQSVDRLQQKKPNTKKTIYI